MLPPDLPPAPVLAFGPTVPSIDATAKTVGFRRALWFGRCLAAALALLASASVFGWSFSRGLSLFGDTIDSALVIGGCLGAAVAAPLTWSLLVPDGMSFRWGLGLVAGILTALTAHLTMWVWALPIFVSEAFTEPSLSQGFAVVWDGLLRIVTMGTFSVMAVGMITVPVGAFGGELVTWLSRWYQRRANGA